MDHLVPIATVTGVTTTIKTDRCLSQIYCHPTKMNVMFVLSLFFLVSVISVSSAQGLFLPDLGLCPAGIETMENFDMEQVSDSDNKLTVIYQQYSVIKSN